MENIIDTFVGNMTEYISVIEKDKIEQKNINQSLITENESLLTENESLITENESLITESESLLTESESLRRYIDILENNTEHTRCDPCNNSYYTRREFFDYYGNLELWDSLDLPFLGMYYERCGRGWKLLCSYNHPSAGGFFNGGKWMGDGWYFFKNNILLYNGATMVNKVTNIN